jgi:hypothetical protein
MDVLHSLILVNNIGPRCYSSLANITQPCDFGVVRQGHTQEDGVPTPCMYAMSLSFHHYLTSLSTL